MQTDAVCVRIARGSAGKSGLGRRYQAVTGPVRRGWLKTFQQQQHPQKCLGCLPGCDDGPDLVPVHSRRGCRNHLPLPTSPHVSSLGLSGGFHVPVCPPEQKTDAAFGPSAGFRQEPWLRFTAVLALPTPQPAQIPPFWDGSPQLNCFILLPLKAISRIKAFGELLGWLWHGKPLLEATVACLLPST